MIDRLKQASRPPVTVGRWALPWPLAMLLLASAYFVTARLGLLLASAHGNVSPVWPATGLAIGGLLLFGRRMWPGVTLGAIAANALTPIPLGAVIGIGTGNTLEALLGAWIVLRSVKALHRFGNLAEPAALVGAALVAPVISALFGVASLGLGGTVPTPALAGLWWTWWVGDAVGALVVTPVLLALHEATRESRRWSVLDGAKVAAVLALTSLVCVLVFFLPDGTGFLFAIFPVLLVAVAWFGSPGVKLTAILIAAISIVAANYGSGPFTGGALNQDLLRLQMFLTSVAVAALVLPAFRAAGSLWVPGAVLLVGWTLSGWMFSSLHRSRLQADQVHFDQLVLDAEQVIRQRLTTYEDALRGGVSLFAASKSVERAEWRDYVNSLRLVERYPGVHGMGVVFPVRAENLSNFLAGVRADGAPDFAVHDVPNVTRPPDGPGGREHFVITFIEPLASNWRGLGLDLASDSNRLLAAEAARDTGLPRMTGRIVLVQDGQKRPGFLLYVPIYRKGEPTSTVEERRAALEGWVYAPFITESFLNGVLGTHDGEVEVRFFEGNSARAEDLLYASMTSRPTAKDFERNTRLELAGQVFTLGWDRGPAFVATDQAGPLFAGTSSALVSLLLAGLVISLQSTGRRANAIAAERTAALASANEALQVEIAEHQRTEEALRESREALEKAQAFGHVGSWVADPAPDGEIQWSAETCRIFGFAPSEFDGKAQTFFELVHPEDRERVRDTGCKILPDDCSYELEYRIVRRDGQTRWIHQQAGLERHSGRLRKVGVVQDITKRKQVEAELRHNRERFELVARGAVDGIWDWNVVTNEDYLSERWCELLGYEPGELSPHFETWVSHLHPDDKDRAFAAVQAHLEKRSPYDLEFRLRLKSGDYRWFRACGQARWDEAGKPQRMAGSITDITARKRAEESLREAKEAAEAATRAKSDFLATMSHEIRTPMNGVIGFTDVLMGSPLTAEQHEWVRTIQTSGLTLLALINDILDFSKIESGQLTFEKIAFDATVAAREVTTLLGPQATEKGLELTLDCVPALPACVTGDPARFKQVLLNLTGNAIKFTKQGSVRVTLGWQAEGADHGTLKVSVRDTGIGISPEKQALLFQKFAQADSSTTRKFGGTGLGLAICKRLVELQDGTIGVDSAPGQGATFWFALPLAVATGGPHETAFITRPSDGVANSDPGLTLRSAPPHAVAPPAPALRVLLAEDVRVNQRLATHLLRRLGWTVDIANDGCEAVALAHQTAYDMILMDCHMPNMDGFEATAEIRRAQQRGRRVPIIALTADAMQGYRERCLAAGMDDYLSKPIVPADLRRVLDQWSEPKPVLAP